MLLDIFVTVPVLLMTNIAWYIHIGFVLMCLVVLFAVAMGAVSFIYRVGEGDTFPSHRLRPKLMREA